MAVAEQLQSLTESFAELEKYNTEISDKVEKLYGRDKNKLHGTLSAETRQAICKRLENLQTNQENSDQKLKHLCNQVNNISVSVDTLQSLLSNCKGLKTNETIRCGLKSDLNNVDNNDQPHSLEKKYLKNSEQSANPINCMNSTEQQERDVEMPVTRNSFGLRVRVTAVEDDNRVLMSRYVGTRRRKVSDNQPAKPNIPSGKKSDRPGNEKRHDMRAKDRKPRRVTTPKNECKNLAGFMPNLNMGASEERDITTWKVIAETERVKGLSSTGQRGRGPDTCLLLDVSQSMTGKPFKRMIKAAKEYVKLVQKINSLIGIEENIGLATIGNETQVVQHMTNEYGKIQECLGTLQTGGPSPISGGLFMALACCLGRDQSRMSGQVELQTKTILFTDGKGTPDKYISGDDTFEDTVENALHIQFFLNDATNDFSNRQLKVYCVPIGDADMTLLDTIVKDTDSKVYKVEEIGKLARMTLNMSHAIPIARSVSKIPDELGADMLSRQLISRHFQQEGDLEPDYEEVIEFAKRVQKEKGTSEEARYDESAEDLPPPGTRVRRGPDWRHRNQDSNGAGTIIGHNTESNGIVWVEWDSGHVNCYRCSMFLGYDILPVDEPRDIRGSNIAVGCLVTRGTDWTYGDQDGGIGNVGVVLRVNDDKRILVRWPNKVKDIYKYGHHNKYDVDICDPKKLTGDVGKLRTHVLGSGSALGGGGATSLQPPEGKASLVDDSNSRSQKKNENSRNTSHQENRRQAFGMNIMDYAEGPY